MDWVVGCLKGFLRKILSYYVYPILNLFHELVGGNYIIISASIKPLKYNWGDDMSIKIAELINPKNRYIPQRYTWNIKKKDNVLCVGSILSWMAKENSIVWGSGVVYPDKPISAIPKKVLAVRGPLSREYLQKQGIDCPEIYGDPALLFPLYYQPKVEKKYRLGIIPHFRDYDNKLLKKYAKYKDVLIIDVRNIKPWHKFIDDICSCQRIVSSSLHGIIISDAYEIPNAWIEFQDGERKRYAFCDYFASVHRSEEEPSLQVVEETTIDDMCIVSKDWKGAKIDLKPLLQVCPFN